jgi:hypothetical protein
VIFNYFCCLFRRQALAVASFSVTLGACTPAASPSRPTISLRLRGGPPDATVVVDEETLGTFDYVAAHGVALPPGVHHVTVQEPGYFPWDREVEAKLGMPPIQLEVVLSAVPD